MYKTGYINKTYSNYIRMKQGLTPQELSNDCRQPSYSNYYPIVLNKYEICNHDNIYFLNMPLLKYLEAP